MADDIDRLLDGLKAAPADVTGLDGLEGAVFGRIAQRRRIAGSGFGVQIGAALAALALGVAVGEARMAQPPAGPGASEMALLSVDGALAPSVRLGGGA
jgi:hypothetical protein